MKISHHSLARLLTRSIPNPERGLGEHWFHTLSSLTPMVNVDLLIQRSHDAMRQTLLTFRQDQFYDGWHFPGGVIRFKESFEARIHEVASIELGCSVTNISMPIMVQNLINPTRRIRGHFVSILFRCELTSHLDTERKHHWAGNPTGGAWSWFSEPPKDLIYQHANYEQFF